MTKLYKYIHINCLIFYPKFSNLGADSKPFTNSILACFRELGRTVFLFSELLLDMNNSHLHLMLFFASFWISPIPSRTFVMS